MADWKTIVVPGSGRALVFYYFGDDVEGEPRYEVTEHPILAWRVDYEKGGGEYHTTPVLPEHWSARYAKVAILYDDGRVVVPEDGEWKDRETFIEVTLKEFDRQRDAQREEARRLRVVDTAKA